MSLKGRVAAGWQRAAGVVVVGALVVSGLVGVEVVTGSNLAPAAAAGPEAPEQTIPTAVTLAADKTDFAVGERVELSAATDEDIRGSSYTVVIKDLTTGSVVGECGSRSDYYSAWWSDSDRTCTATTSFASGGPHTYQAYVAASTDLDDVQATSNEVVLERGAWSVTLAADKTVFAAGERVTLTATPDQNIRGSAYMVVIRDVTAGSVVGRCETTWDYGAATWSKEHNTCTATTSFTTGGPHTYRAYVAENPSFADVQAESNSVVAARAEWNVTLAADKTVFAAGERVTLTATPDQNIRGSAYMVVIRDVTAGSVVGRCETTWDYGAATWSKEHNTCTATTSFTTGGPHTYRAYVAENPSLDDVQAESNPVVIRRMPWTVTLATSKSIVASGEQVTLTATPNQNIRGSAYMVVIRDVTAGSVVGRCETTWDYGAATWSKEHNTCTASLSLTLTGLVPCDRWQSVQDLAGFGGDDGVGGDVVAVDADGGRAQGP